MDLVTPKSLICLWMFPRFTGESSPPSPHPPDHGGKLHDQGNRFGTFPCMSCNQAQDCLACNLDCTIHVSYSPFSHLLILLFAVLVSPFLHPRFLPNRQPTPNCFSFICPSFATSAPKWIFPRLVPGQCFLYVEILDMVNYTLLAL